MKEIDVTAPSTTQGLSTKEFSTTLNEVEVNKCNDVETIAAGTNDNNNDSNNSIHVVSDPVAENNTPLVIVNPRMDIDALDMLTPLQLFELKRKVAVFCSSEDKDLVDEYIAKRKGVPKFGLGRPPVNESGLIRDYRELVYEMLSSEQLDEIRHTSKYLAERKARGEEDLYVIDANGICLSLSEFYSTDEYGNYIHKHCFYNERKPSNKGYCCMRDGMDLKREMDRLK